MKGGEAPPRNRKVLNTACANSASARVCPGSIAYPILLLPHPRRGAALSNSCTSPTGSSAPRFWARADDFVFRKRRLRTCGREPPHRVAREAEPPNNQVRSREGGGGYVSRGKQKHKHTFWSARGRCPRNKQGHGYENCYKNTADRQ